MKASISIILALGLLGLSAAPASAAGCATYHTVRFGENLFRIGLRYGLTWTSLAAANGLPNPRLIYAGQVLCIPTTAAVSPPATAGTIPTFTIIRVVRDQTVTIRTANFPANQPFTALMGPMSTRGVNGVEVVTTDSGAGGTFTATYTIPTSLRGSRQISIRLQSPAGYFSYNWFYNNTTP